MALTMDYLEINDMCLLGARILSALLPLLGVFEDVVHSLSDSSMSYRCLLVYTCTKIGSVLAPLILFRSENVGVCVKIDSILAVIVPFDVFT